MTVNSLAATAERKRTWDARSGGFTDAKPIRKIKPFILGPLPLDWINIAGALQGKSLQVGLVLWYLSGVCKSKTIRLGNKQLFAMGVARDAKYQALNRLQQAGLVLVDQQPGRVPAVTLLDAPDVKLSERQG